MDANAITAEGPQEAAEGVREPLGVSWYQEMRDAVSWGVSEGLIQRPKPKRKASQVEVEAEVEP